jgi:RND family efflux transporter MFP subunit
VGDLVDPSRPVAVVAVLSKVKVVLPVTQRDLRMFHEGDEISVSAAGLDEIFAGVVHSIGYTADERTRTFPVVLEVPNPELELRAGMVVEARVRVGSAGGVFVPLDAVSRDAGGQPVVQLVDPEGLVVRPRRVRLGRLIGERALVEEGLSPGERFVVRGLVQPGSPVVETRAMAASSGTEGR